MRSIVIPVIASILILGSVGLTQDIVTQAFAGADPADIVYQNGNPNSSNGLYMDMAITANDFVLGEDLELTDVHFILQDDSGNGLNVPIQYEIRVNDVDMPDTGAPLFSGTGINLDTEQIEDGPFGPRLLVWFDFEEAIPLSGGVTYWLVLHAGIDINDNTMRGFFWEASDVNIGFIAVSSINGVPVPDELFDTWFQLTSKQTPETQIKSLIEDIEVIVDEGILNNGNGNALISKLNNAIANIDKGNTNAAENQLNAFINQVNAFVNSNKLTAQQGQDLIDAIQAIIDSL